MAHQMALNPGSKSTPVRTVFNNSWMFRGFKLNSGWALGPDIMNSLHTILMRFRKDEVGAQGDIAKMYYMIRVTIEEEMMQLFVWKFGGEERIRTLCMTRLVMGNKMSANLSPEQFPVAYNVDNVFITAPNIDKLGSGIEEILFKEWIVLDSV